MRTHAAETQPDSPPASLGDLKLIKRSALKMMEDVVPHAPTSDEMVKISNGRNRALWGAIFGDTQIGALVAVQADADKPGSDANLCLLLWQDGWKFAQRVGTVSSAPNASNWGRPQGWDWDIKRQVPRRVYYVINSFDPNCVGHRERLSWLCDPQTHSLLPTGWPKDAIPSISGTTITFKRCEKSGNSTPVMEIEQFDGSPGKNIAIYSVTFDEKHRPIVTISIPDSATGKRITWRIAEAPKKQWSDATRYFLCYSPTDGKLEPFHEDATVNFQWQEGQYPFDAIGFLIWRLTGIEKAAQSGEWDEDVLREKERGRDVEMPKPLKVIVEGIPEAVKAFSWPESQAETEP